MRSKVSAGEGRHSPPRRDAARPLDRVGEHRHPGRPVDEARRQARQPRPTVDEAHRCRRPAGAATLIVVRAKLGLVGRHVDVDGAIAFAALAGEAKDRAPPRRRHCARISRRLRRAASRTACAPGRASRASRPVSPCSSGTSHCRRGQRGAAFADTDTAHARRVRSCHRRRRS